MRQVDTSGQTYQMFDLSEVAIPSLIFTILQRFDLSEVTYDFAAMRRGGFRPATGATNV
jgi:hypothetical protein